jgi:hypothetical protein
LQQKTPYDLFARIEKLKPLINRIGSIRQEEAVKVHGTEFPIYSIHLGSKKAEAPSIVFTGGVHGLEVIGSEVLISFLETLCSLSEWDTTIQTQLEHIKIIFYPFVNPGGMVLKTRCNPNGVDLMRNAPIEADNIPPLFLPGGHRISPKLPWYRGHEGDPMELENRTLFRVLKEEIWKAPLCLLIDFHSGFGMKDRIWFPFAYTYKPFPRLAEIFKLKTLFDQSYPYNIHTFEPQAKQYRTHGDFWDYVFLEHEKEHPQNVMIPLCLELGSWIWIKKNPRQIFTILGLFNPIVPHRQQRTLRRHIYLLDFFLRATHAFQSYRILDQEEHNKSTLLAHDFWYSGV